MPREEQIVAGRALECGALVLVPLLRIRAHAFARWAGAAESDVVGFVCSAGDTPPRMLALDDALATDDACSAWLAARPELLDAIRRQLARRRRP